MEEPKNNNEKGKNITILGSKSIAVPDVFKLYIMALLHKYETRMNIKKPKKEEVP